MADPVSSYDAKLLKNLGGVGLVMTIIFTLSVVLLIAIIVKRQMLRMLLLSKRGPHSPVGSDAPRNLGREITAHLQRISQLRMEPRMLSEQFNKPADGTSNFDSPSDQYTRSYKYRMKAMDKMTELGLQNVPVFLFYFLLIPCIYLSSIVLSKMLICLIFKEFGALQYRKFAYLVEELKDRVRLYVNVPGSLIIAGNSKKPIRKPPSSTKIEEPSMEVKAIPETEADSGNMTRSGAMSM
ncbi:uncharacterized protein LOC113672627 [Pocillopora damicornis]|uniref:uncharacterized protein LOC113672627 n=1 Tax=Pocillopora damicornis TaxID=46731 RepID=UPI000F558480|nr:uncharacterized protein LOC113672627 [Pocillopora damicornis]